MTDPRRYLKRIMDFPAIVQRPEDAKLDALIAGGGRALVQEETAFQRILLVETPKKELLLLLDGAIQFYSGDEHRYHEALTIIPALFKEGQIRRIGIMGGGDGLAARELLRHYGKEIELIRVIDIDPAMTELAMTHPRLVDLNQGSLLDPRVEVINADALSYRSPEPFDLIIGDLPDPTNETLGRLYNQEFYRGVEEQLAPTGLFGVQIVFVPPLFDGVLSTLRSVFPSVREYTVWMYSFIRAGFALCGRATMERCRPVPDGTRHLTDEVLRQAFYFAPDDPREPTDHVSTDENGLVVEWFERYLEAFFEERILYY